MISGTPSPTLIGVDTFLNGNESKIWAAMPVVRFYDGQLAVVRSVNWDVDPHKLRLISQSELENVPCLPQCLAILPNQLAVIIGPAFYKNLIDIGLINSLSPLGDSISSESGFFIYVADLITYREVKTALVKRSIDIFDSQLELAWAQHISPEAKSALDLLVGNPDTPQEYYYIRLAASLFIGKKNDEFRTLCEMGAIILNIEFSTLSELVRQYVIDRVQSASLQQMQAASCLNSSAKRLRKETQTIPTHLNPSKSEGPMRPITFPTGGRGKHNNPENIH